MMQFSIGDKIVHPNRGPGRIIGVEQREYLDEKRRYYVLEIPIFETIVHIPVGKATELGLRPAMPRAKVARVLDTLGSTPHRLSQDYRERQEDIQEKMRTARPIATAEAVRDLTWRGRHANLGRTDSALLQRGQDFLAAEMALVLDTGVREASERIDLALNTSMAAMQEREARQEQLAAAIH